MSIKVKWDNSNNEFYVEIGKNRRIAKKSSREMIKYLESITDSEFDWSWAAKKQVSKGK